MKLWITCTLVLAANIGSLADYDPFLDDDHDEEIYQPIHVRVQLKMIETSQTELTKITSNPQPLQENLYTSIQRLMKSGKAKLIHESVAVSRSGEKTSTESVCEMIYPTEYEPPGYEPPKIQSTTPHVRPVGATPTAFETRNVGVTLEIEPLVSDNGKVIDLRIAPDRVMFNRNITYLTHKDQWGKADLFFPEFYLQRSTTAVTLFNKETRFIASHTPLNVAGNPDPSRKILVFVKATVIRH